MEPKDIHQIIEDIKAQDTEFLGKALGIELENFGSGLAHVSIMKRQFNSMKNDYAELLRAYEILEKKYVKLSEDYECLSLDAKDRHMLGDWK
jgi:hypothetical protein